MAARVPDSCFHTKGHSFTAGFPVWRSVRQLVSPVSVLPAFKAASCFAASASLRPGRYSPLRLPEFGEGGDRGGKLQSRLMAGKSPGVPPSEQPVLGSAEIVVANIEAARTVRQGPVPSKYSNNRKRTQSTALESKSSPSHRRKLQAAATDLTKVNKFRPAYCFGGEKVYNELGVFPPGHTLTRLRILLFRGLQVPAVAEQQPSLHCHPPPEGSLVHHHMPPAFAPAMIPPHLLAAGYASAGHPQLPGMPWFPYRMQHQPHPVQSIFWFHVPGGGPCSPVSHHQFMAAPMVAPMGLISLNPFAQQMMGVLPNQPHPGPIAQPAIQSNPVLPPRINVHGAAASLSRPAAFKQHPPPTQRAVNICKKCNKPYKNPFHVRDQANKWICMRIEEG